MDEVDPLGGDVPEADRPRKAPSVDDLLAQIDALGYGTPEYFDCMGFLFTVLARSQWRRADQARADVRRRERLAAGRAADGRRVVRHGTCPMCQATVRLRMDGTVRVHDTGSGAAQSRAIYGAGNRCAGAGLPPVA